MMAFLAGKKTYLAALAVAVITALASTGAITQSTAEMVIGILTALGLTTARQGASADAAKALDAAKAHVADVIPSASSAKPDSGRALLPALLAVAALALLALATGCGPSARTRAAASHIAHSLPVLYERSRPAPGVDVASWSAAWDAIDREAVEIDWSLSGAPVTASAR